MTQYYYIVSSLPHLSYSMDKAPSVDQFILTCRDHLSQKDAHNVLSAKLNDFNKKETTESSVLKQWYTWEIDFRNKLSRLRAKKKNLDPDSFIHENPELTTGKTAVEDAFKEPSPLTGENILNKARWTFLDDLETGHYFDTEKLIIYYLKLQILQRKGYFTKELGAEKFQNIVEDIASADFPRGGKKKETAVKHEVADGK